MLYKLEASYTNKNGVILWSGISDNETMTYDSSPYAIRRGGVS